MLKEPNLSLARSANSSPASNFTACFFCQTLPRPQKSFGGTLQIMTHQALARLPGSLSHRGCLGKGSSPEMDHTGLAP